MKKVLTGNQAVAWGVMRSRAQVISAYPITPQTSIIEELAELVDKKKLDAQFIKVESEHSAMAGCIGAQSTGARTFTATSAQGLALMHELLHWAALGRLPIVMADVNRSMAPGWSIWTDQNDSLSQRDTGWLQYYCESNQEIIDTVLQAYRVAEAVDLPVMVILDAFFLSHTNEIVEIPSPEDSDLYLPKYDPPIRLDVNNPRAFGGIVMQDIYMEFRYNMQLAMDKAVKLAKEADDKFKKIFGRSYGLVESYRADDAELIIVTSGSPTSTARDVIDDYRSRGKSVGLVKMRLFRPFPADDVREALKNAKRVAVLDRNISAGMGGIFAQEIRAAMYQNRQKSSPHILGYIVGLGGRDITPPVISSIIDDAFVRNPDDGYCTWIGIKE